MQYLNDVNILISRLILAPNNIAVKFLFQL